MDLLILLPILLVAWVLSHPVALMVILFLAWHIGIGMGMGNVQTTTGHRELSPKWRGYRNDFLLWCGIAAVTFAIYGMYSLING